MRLDRIQDVEICLRTFAVMTEGDVRRWIHDRLPTLGEQVDFDDLSRGCSKSTVDLLAARALLRAQRINGLVCPKQP